MDQFSQILVGQAALRVEISKVHERMDDWFKTCSRHNEDTVALRTKQDRVITDLTALEARVSVGLQEVRDRQEVAERTVVDVAEKAALKVVESLRGNATLTVLKWAMAVIVTLVGWGYAMWMQLRFPVPKP